MWRLVACVMLGHAVGRRGSTPYRDRAGKTHQNPDGYRVVLQQGTWPPVRA